MISSNSGMLPVHNSKSWYCSLDIYDNALNAKNALQMPQPTGSIVARIEFDLSNVKNNIRAAFDADDANKEAFELLARAFPDNSITPPGGGGTQFLVDGAEVTVTLIKPL